MNNHPQRKPNKKLRIVIIVLISALLIAALVVGILKYRQLESDYQQLKTDPETSQKAAQEQVESIKAKVAALIAVPDETPTVATIQDKTKLQDQPFFDNAENGDKILIFTAAKKAIIYRESTNKLINVGPIAVTSDAAAATTTTK